MDDVDKDNNEKTYPGKVGNLGKPILLNGLAIDGVAANSARASERVQIMTRLTLSSDSLGFHKIVENLISVIQHHAQLSGLHVSLEGANTILLVIKPDNSAELWVDTAAVSLLCIVKRELTAGSVVFESDIADITGMSFPCVSIESADRVICIFRESWRFGMFFDFNPDRNLLIDDVTKSLGTLFRNLKYRHLYDVVADAKLFNQIVSAGWFPFVEIIGSEFKDLVNSCEAGFELNDVETTLLAKFDEERLDRMLSRWVAKPHFSNKKDLFTSAINAYKKQDPIPVIKIILTEIEGVLMAAYKTQHGKGASIKDLLAFAVDSATKKAGLPSTLFFPEEFAKYLEKNTFANFDPKSSNGTAGSRHAVGHGAAVSETYTLVRALQAILTLDQIAFYT